jgi:centrosomal protein CEP104
LDLKGSFTKLGHVSIEDNDKNQYKARELKTIHIDTRASYLKITMFKCHINPLNLYNQIGIVALNILGSKLDSDQIRDLESEPALFQQSQITRGIIERSFADENTPIDGDLNYVDHDRYLVHALTALAEKKKHAIQKENYLLAKKLKLLQTEFANTSNTVMTLLSEKRAALKLEDFDSATNLQSQIENIKTDISLKLKEAGYELHPEGLVLLEDSLNMSSKAFNPQSSVYHDSFSNLSVADIPIQSKISVSNAQKASRPASARHSTDPDNLDEQQVEEYALAIKIFGIKTLTGILSSFFNHREQGLNAAIQYLESLKGASLDFDRDEIVGATFQILSFIITDSREKSHALMCNLYLALFKFCKVNDCRLDTLLSYLTDSVYFLLNKTADLNPRIRQKSIDLVMSIVEKFHSRDLNILPVIIKPYSTNTLHSVPWKHVKARLDLATELLDIYGVSDSKSDYAHQISWSSQNVLEFAKPLVLHTKPDVRDSAIAVLCKLVQLVPNCFKSLQDLSPTSLSQIQKRASLRMNNDANFGRPDKDEHAIDDEEKSVERETFEQ